MAKTYEVYITETRIHKVEVDADLDEQAEAIAVNLWQNHSSDVKLINSQVVDVVIKDKREVYQA